MQKHMKTKELQNNCVYEFLSERRQQLHYTHKAVFVTTYLLLILQIKVTPAFKFSDK